MWNNIFRNILQKVVPDVLNKIFSNIFGINLYQLGYVQHHQARCNRLRMTPEEVWTQNFLRGKMHVTSPVSKDHLTPNDFSRTSIGLSQQVWLDWEHLIIISWIFGEFRIWARIQETFKELKLIHNASSGILLLKWWHQILQLSGWESLRQNYI